MKVIFLDFDGVLNSNRYFFIAGCEGLAIDPECMDLLKKLVKDTNVKIVLTTSWREHWDQDEKNCTVIGKEINTLFSRYQLKVFDKTPKLSTGRESEIEAWLDENPQVDAFVVLDDCFLDSPRIRGRVCKTDFYRRGLDEKTVAEAKNILEQTL